MSLVELTAFVGRVFINPEHVSKVDDMGEGVTRIFLVSGHSELIFGEISDVLRELSAGVTTG